MPLLAVLVGSLSGALANFFAQFLGFKVALKLAAYTTWVAIFAAFLASVYICMSSLLGMASALFSGAGGGGGSSWVRMFFMGLGMFIPSNAGAVMACVGSVWIGTGIYKFQKNAVQIFGGG